MVRLAGVLLLVAALVGCGDGGGGGGGTPPVTDNPVPTLTSISPTSTAVGGAAFALTVNGSNFISGSVVRWNGSGRATTFVSSAQLTATILASDITAAGTAQVTVFNPTPGGGTSAASTFTIGNPVPTLTSLSPTSAAAGGAAFTLTVNGSNFISGSVVRWNGSGRATTFVGNTQLTAAILAGDIANAGTAQVTVFNPAPGGGTSSPLTFTVTSSLGRNDTCTPGSTVGTTAISNGRFRASISPYGDIDIYSFSGTAGAQVTIETFAQRLDLDGNPNTRDSYLDTLTELLGSNCSRLTFNDDINPGVVLDSRIQGYTLPSTGTYFIRIRDFRGDGRPDLIYELSLAGAN